MAVGQGAARQPDAEIGLAPERLFKTKLGVGIAGRNDQPQGPLRREEMGRIEIVIRIGGQRPTTVERLIEAQLQQLSAFRIDLCGGGLRRRAEQQGHNERAQYDSTQQTSRGKSHG